MAALEPTPAQEAVYDGKRKYAEKQYKAALELFTRAMRLCPCNRGMKRDRCACKNFEDVAARNESIFREAMYNCKCAVGKRFSKCENSAHIDALDYRAATFETMKYLDRAKRDAEWMLELAPRLPDGYLRLGKIARLLKEDEFAWKVYKAGIEVASGNLSANPRKLQQLHIANKTLQMRFFRKDPLLLPAEIIQWIMSYCDLVTRVRCLRVSKSWNQTLSAPGNANLWRILEFRGRSAPRVSPRTEGLRKLTAKSGNDVRKLVIPNAHSFGLMQSKFLALLNGAKNLEHLEIGLVMRGLELPSYAGMCKTLQHLSLAYFDANSPPKNVGADIIRSFPHTMVQNVANVLQHLQLTGLPIEWFQSQAFPVMKELRTMKLQLKTGTEQPIPLMYIAENTPKLEQIFLDEVWITAEPGWGEQWDKVWPSLKSITIVALAMPNRTYMPGVTILTSINRGEALRNIDLSFANKAQLNEDILTPEPINEMLGWSGISAGAQGVYPRANAYFNLERLRIDKMALNPATLQRLVSEPIRMNRLTHFDISFPLESLNSKLGEASALHLAKYEWLRGCSSLRSIGVSEFRFRAYPRNDDDLPLPSFLASFPALEEVELSSSHYEDHLEFSTVIEAVLKATKIKRLYQSQVTGVILDKLPALAERYGVEILWGQRARHWPLVFDE